MESFPPIGGIFNSFVILYAPNKAVNGFAHFVSSSPNFSKYSWKDNLERSAFAPTAAILHKLSTTA